MSGMVNPTVFHKPVRPKMCLLLGLGVLLGVLTIDAQPGRAGTCAHEQVNLDSLNQALGCFSSLRPKTVGGLDAGFVITAQTQVDPSAPDKALAAGEPGMVVVDTSGAGVRAAACVGNKAMFGYGSEQDEELTLTFDAPVLASTVVLELRKVNFAADSPVLFLSSGETKAFDFSVSKDELVAAFTSLGGQTGEVHFGKLSSLPLGTTIDTIKIRELSGAIFLGGVRVGVTCDDSNPCTLDQCVKGQCAYENLPSGTACGDATDSDCTDPDTCDGLGKCLANDAADGTPCADGIACTGAEVCGAGTCGPDVCGQFTGGCAGNEWSCGGNWTFGGTYPDNDNGQRFSVLLDQTDDVFLDVDVNIDGLTMIDQSILRVTQMGAFGNLFIVTESGLHVQGKIYINNGKRIDLLGTPLWMGPGGLYSFEPEDTRSAGVDAGLKVDPDFVGPLAGQMGERQGSSFSDAGTVTVPATAGFSEGTLVPGSVLLEAGSPCPPTCPAVPGGTIILSGSMVLEVDGDFTLDGTGAGPCGDSFRGVIVPPPKFRATAASQTSVDGNVNLSGSVDMFHSSENNLLLGGDFNNQSDGPGCFDWTQGGLTFSGPAPQSMEVAGRDEGPTAGGFDRGLDTNFAMGRLEVAGNRTLTLQNEFGNTVGAGSCLEALYVDELFLRSGSTLIVDQCRIYYRTLVQETDVKILILGCGELEPLPDCLEAPDCADGDICTNDACGPEGECTHTPIPQLLYGDLDYNGGESDVDVDDILCALSAFTGYFGDCPLERADVSPCQVPTCVTDADCAEFGVPCQSGRCHVLDVDDILAVIDAFSGFSACPNPCGP